MRKQASFGYMHVLQLQLRYEGKLSADQRYASHNCALIGPTASGKTSAVRALAELLPKSVGVAIIDMSRLTPEGYKGTNFSEALLAQEKILSVKKQKLEDAIIMLDEFDKVLGNFNTGEVPNNVEDILLSMTDGDNSVTVKDDAHRTRVFNTCYNSFVLAGSFQETVDQIQSRKSCGFLAEESPKQLGFEEIMEQAGVKMELVGRFSLGITLKKAGKNDYLKLLHSNFYPGFLGFLQATGSSLSLDENWIQDMAEHLTKGRTGVRGLEDQLLSAYYEMIGDGQVFDRSFKIRIGECENNPRKGTGSSWEEAEL